MESYHCTAMCKCLTVFGNTTDFIILDDYLVIQVRNPKERYSDIDPYERQSKCCAPVNMETLSKLSSDDSSHD